MHDRGDGVEEGKLGLAGQRLHGARERGRGEGACRHDDAVPIGRGQGANLFSRDADQRLIFEPPRHLAGKAFAVDGECASCRQLVTIGGAHDQGAGPAHFLVQQPDGIARPIVRAERVGADELGKCAGLMRLGPPERAHLVQHHRHAGGRKLPSGLAPGKAAADDMHRFHHGG